MLKSIWIPVETTISMDYRVDGVASMLNIPTIYAIGVVVQFWAWARITANEDGTLSMTAEQVGKIVWGRHSGYPQPEGLAGALLEYNFLAKRPDGKLHVTDFEFLTEFWRKKEQKKTADNKRKQEKRNQEQVNDGE